MSDIQFTVGGDFSILDKFANKVTSTLAKVSAGFQARIGQKAFDGLLSAAQSIPDIFREVVEAGGKLTDQMTATGAAGERLYVMGRVFENAGLSADSTTSALGRLEKAIAGINEENQTTGEAFDQLGLSMSDLRSMDPVAAFEATGKAIAAIEDPAGRAALAARIFGKAGMELNAVFRDSTAWDSARAQVGGLGASLAANAGSYDAIGDSWGAMNLKAMQFVVGLTEGFLPAMQKTSVALAETDFTGWGRGLAGFVGMLWDGAKAAGDLADKLMPFQKKARDAFAGWISDKAAAKTFSDAAAAGDSQGPAAAASGTKKKEPTQIQRAEDDKNEKKAADLREKYLKDREAARLAAMQAEDRAAELSRQRGVLLESANKRAGTSGLDVNSLGDSMAASPPADKQALADVYALLVDIEQKDKDIAAAAKEAASAREKMEKSGKDFAAELEMARAKAAGDEATIERLTRQKDLEEGIQKLKESGYSEQAAAEAAAAMADAKAAERAKDLAKKQAENQRAAADAADTLAAAAGDKGAQARIDSRKTSARAAELRDQGMDPATALKTASAEAAAPKMEDMANRRDALERSVSNVYTDSMQRVGGGGMSVGYDYGRIQADLQRQMVDLLRTIAGAGDANPGTGAISLL